MRKVGISEFVVMILSFLMGGVMIGRQVSKEANVYYEEVNKVNNRLMLLNRWLELKQNGCDVCRYLESRSYSRIIVYGMGICGERMCQELDQAAKLVAVVDRDAALISKGYPYTIISPDDVIPDADCMIVTEVHCFESIKNNMKEKVDCDIVSLEEVLFNF